ncbi:hypothetical protein HNR42_001707 [Deinobacterium chartae]|uniref:Uncharacterized protein n=1 Tax=Deinobacterium chartae TaxID=521158 RepID=A0A841I2L0_9DEIO|nr:hypothetical protein [Deinobacterium chartae]MBB6098282.1 hypothetical protein [Deinobacterium chartae]
MPSTSLRAARFRIALAAVLFGLTTGLAQVSGDYLMKVSPSAERVTVRVNERQISFSSRRIALTSIRSYLNPGRNNIRIYWRNLERAGDVSILRASSVGREVLFHYPLAPGVQPRSGTTAFTVVVDPQQTDAQRGRMNVNMTGGFLSVTINGNNLGDYPGTTERDIGRYLQRGQNTIRIAWSKEYGVSLPVGTLVVSYGTPLREVFRWNTDLISRLQGEQTFNFEIP